MAHRLRLVVRDRQEPSAPSVDRWEAYERRKAEIAETATSAAEYERLLRELAEGMGL
jgi:hypothetical protein